MTGIEALRASLHPYIDGDHAIHAALSELEQLRAEVERLRAFEVRHGLTLADIEHPDMGWNNVKTTNAVRTERDSARAEVERLRAESAARLVTIRRESAWVNERGGVIAFFVGVLAEVLRAKTIEDARTFAETALVTNEEWHAGTWKPGPGEDAAKWRTR